MQPEMTNFQAFAASLAVEGEVCDLPNARLWMQAADAEIAPLVQRLGATSTAEIDRLIAELQEAKDHLQSERERIELGTLRYTSLAQIASTTAKVISDAVSQWHPTRNGLKSNTTEAVAASPLDGNGDKPTLWPRGASHQRDRSAPRAFASRKR
jgi:hypothetical protein